MRAFTRTFSAGKVGNLETEYDDASWPNTEAELVGRLCRLAIADGATESSFAGEWARQLVREFGVGRMTDPSRSRRLISLRQEWSEVQARKELPWYAEEKARDGAHAAFLGLLLRDPGHFDEPGEWLSIAIGDSCLAQVRQDDLLTFFPVEISRRFAERPYLLCSVAERNRDLSTHTRRTKGQWQTDDVFFLMTDALAAWFLGEVEAGAAPWRRLRDFGTHDEEKPFGEFLSDLRSCKQIKNDDVTLLRIDLMAG